MSLYNTFKTDENLETGEGVNLDYGDGVLITIHRAGGANTKYSRVASQKLKPHSRKIQNGTADTDAIRKVMAEIYAEAVVIGWKGVKDESGKDMKFTKENCVKLLTDLPDLFNDIQDQADKISLFRKEETEEIAKN